MSSQNVKCTLEPNLPFEQCLLQLFVIVWVCVCVALIPVMTTMTVMPSLCCDRLRRHRHHPGCLSSWIVLMSSASLCINYKVKLARPIIWTCFHLTLGKHTLGESICSVLSPLHIGWQFSPMMAILAMTTTIRDVNLHICQISFPPLLSRIKHVFHMRNPKMKTFARKLFIIYHLIWWYFENIRK